MGDAKRRKLLDVVLLAHQTDTLAETDGCLLLGTWLSHALRLVPDHGMIGNPIVGSPRIGFKTRVLGLFLKKALSAARARWWASSACWLR